MVLGCKTSEGETKKLTFCDMKKTFYFFDMPLDPSEEKASVQTIEVGLR
jgi:hypothetical protein